MGAPQEIQELVERYDRNKQAYESGPYNETQVRREFIDPFLKEIEGWRQSLAENIALRNHDLTQRELNFSVQRIIDRIIFLRICEDRGIEEYGQLQALRDGGGVYERLCDLFQRADEQYNSGLFHFLYEKDRAEPPDKLTPGLRIDDKPLWEIINRLYYPESPYEFYVLPADILGQVYEQFLGKIISLTVNHRAVVDDKPEVRKAGGVYYSPTFVVNYMVQQVVGSICSGKTPKEVSKIRILDPACGSGSFLIAAYQFMLDWHAEWYLSDGEHKHRDVMYEAHGGAWRLSTAERKRILLNNIYGVDIDSQAVEVTKLSLLLKVLEGESSQALTSQLRLFHARALPDLGDNIKCGNSLISPDFYDNVQRGFLNEDEIYRINVFSWENEFPSIMKGGGFNAIIGNPPYGIVFDDTIKPYLERKHPAFVRNNDTYVAFTERSISLLTSEGVLGFIIPSTFLTGPYFDDFKRAILARTCVRELVDFGLNQVFRKPNVFTALLFLSNNRQASKTRSRKKADQVPRFARIADLSAFPGALDFQDLDAQAIESLNWLPSGMTNVSEFKNTVPLNAVAWVKDVGLNYWTRGRGKTRGGSIADRVLYNGSIEHPHDKAYLKGRDIGRYSLTFGDHWLRHNYQELLDPTVDTFRFSPEFLEREKIVYRQTADKIIATLEPDHMLTDKTVHSIIIRDEWRKGIEPKYLLGLLNSRLMTHIYRELANEKGRTFAQVKVFRMKSLPIRIIDFDDKEDRALHDRIVTLVDQMLLMIKQLASSKTEHSQVGTRRLLQVTDRQIDAVVYELYGVTGEKMSAIDEQEGKVESR